MTVWDYPALVIAALAGAILFSAWLMRAGGRNTAHDFECDLCGRKQRNLYARQWRFCPFCGAPLPRPPPRY